MIHMIPLQYVNNPTGIVYLMKVELLNIKLIFNWSLKSRKCVCVLLQEGGFHAENCNCEVMEKPQILFLPRFQNMSH